MAEFKGSTAGANVASASHVTIEGVLVPAMNDEIVIFQANGTSQRAKATGASPDLLGIEIDGMPYLLDRVSKSDARGASAQRNLPSTRWVVR